MPPQNIKPLGCIGCASLECTAVNSVSGTASELAGIQNDVKLQQCEDQKSQCINQDVHI